MERSTEAFVQRVFLLRRKPAEEVITTLRRLERKLPKKVSKTRRKELRKEREYSTNRRERMDYAHYQERGLPIGSGVVEAACKTVGSQQL